MTASHPRAMHSVSTLGVYWLIYGALRIIRAIWLVFFAGTATLMFGALLNRVANPFSLMAAFHVIYGVVIALDLAIGLLGLIAGGWLMSSHESSRKISLLAAYLSLPDLPLGVILGVFTIVTFAPLP